MAETNAERLARIKQDSFLFKVMGSSELRVSMNHIDQGWLFDQVERAQKFEERLQERGSYTKRVKVRLGNMEKLAEIRLSKNRRMKREYYHSAKDIKVENERLKKALYVSLFHAVESQSDGTVDVITDTLQGLDYTDMWDADYEKGKKLWEDWMK